MAREGHTRFLAEIEKDLAKDFKIKLLKEELPFKVWFEDKVKQYLGKKGGNTKKKK